MYVIATSPRLSRGGSSPATLALVALRFSLSSGGFAAAPHVRAPTLPAQPLSWGEVPEGGQRPPPGNYPCRALCRGFLQMMRVTPRRLVILRCSHRALIDGLTFIVPSRSLRAFRAAALPPQ